MAYLRIAPRNFHDEATVTVSAEVTGFEAVNTQNDIRTRVWRTPSGADATVDGTFPDALARTVSVFGMFLHRCHGGDIRLRLYSDAAWTTQVYDSTALDVINVVPTDGMDWGVNAFPAYSAGDIDPFIEYAPYWLWLPSVACKSYRITLTNHSSDFGRAEWQVSRFFLGYHLEMLRQPEFGVQLGRIDLTDRNRSRGGSLRTNLGSSFRTMEMNLGAMEEDERAAWLDIMQYTGTARAFLLSLFPELGTRMERDHTMLCKFTALNAIGREVHRLTHRIQIEEL